MNTSTATAPPAFFEHCVVRCVRFAYLCGEDPRTGINHDHRLGWLDERLAELASIFAVRIHGHRALSQQLHLALQFDPGCVESWTDQEVGARWNRLWRRASLAEAEQAERIAAWLASPDKLADMRQRLASPSEFMRALTQHIALRANREDGCRGHFWEPRRKVREFPDAAALGLAFMDVECGLQPKSPEVVSTRQAAVESQKDTGHCETSSLTPQPSALSPALT
jgi:hypothetical protein